MRYDTTTLTEAQLRRGLSITELARRCELSPSTISATLRGLTAHPPTVRRIAYELGVPMDDLILSSETPHAGNPALDGE